MLCRRCLRLLRRVNEVELALPTPVSLCRCLHKRWCHRWARRWLRGQLRKRLRRHRGWAREGHHAYRQG